MVLLTNMDVSERVKWKSILSSTLRCLMSDWSNLQAFGWWKPYLVPVSNLTIPETSAPKLKQKKVRLGFKELVLVKLFHRTTLSTAGTGKYSGFCVFINGGSSIKNYNNFSQLLTETGLIEVNLGFY